MNEEESKSIAWQIPAQIIEMAMKLQNGFQGDVSVWSAGFDENTRSVIVVMDIDAEEWEKLRLDPEYEDAATDFFPLEDGNLPVQ